MGTYNKLVRDNIPNIIINKGENPVYRIMDLEEHKKELNLKLLEEVKEYLESEELSEIADIAELIKAIGELQGCEFEEMLDKTKYYDELKDLLNIKALLILQTSEYLKDHDIFKLVGVLNLLKEIVKTKQETFDTIINLMKEKREKRGGFTKRIYLIGVKVRA